MSLYDDTLACRQMATTCYCRRMATITVRDAAQLGSAVREARVRAGMSQTELAADSSVGRQWLVAFEAGDKASAPFDMVMRVLQVLDLNVTLDSSVITRPPRSSRRTVVRASDILARYENETPS